jgi:hypothetical protein
MSARIRLDESIFAHKLVAPGMDPVCLASTATMQEQQRFSRTFHLVIHLHLIQRNTFSFHGEAFWQWRGLQTIRHLRMIESMIHGQQNYSIRPEIMDSDSRTGASAV